MKIRILLSVLLMVVCAAAFDPRIDNWYAVEDWELEICSKWGGTTEAQSGGTSSQAVFLSQNTISLQGRRQVYNVEGFDRTLYTASWYIEPIADLGYRVELVGQDKEYVLDHGTASISSPGTGYYADYSNESYTGVRITYGDAWLRVPLVELR